MSRPPISETDLQAYVDDRLTPSRRAEIDAYLAMHPAEAARLAEYRRQNEQLRALLKPALNEPIPTQLRRSPRTSLHGLRWRAAAMVIWIGLGGLLGTMLGWELRGGPPMVAQIPQMTETPDTPRATVGQRLARRAAVAHAVYSPDTRRPVEIGADQEAQLVSWLSKRLGVKLKPPSLQAQGYELIGGRLLPGAKGPVAQFMYHDTKGQRLTLYVSSERQDKQDTAFHFAEEGPIGVFYWIDNGMGYAISAGTNRNELARVALAVYNQISPQ